MGGSRLHSDEEVSVLVELSERDPDDDCIRQLQDAGLTIDEVIGNTVVGRVDRKSEATLEALPFVVAIERSVQLKPH